MSEVFLCLSYAIEESDGPWPWGPWPLERGFYEWLGEYQNEDNQ